MAKTAAICPRAEPHLEAEAEAGIAGRGPAPPQPISHARQGSVRWRGVPHPLLPREPPRGRE